ncbi:hypothetical protein [Tolypothrix sp. VBCCA 56010]|uniref:hypothetical protein n=1 Tax=Tolypothrix sp. VBCCA 56010 TaxID=3137731 RepID=UPI003D7EB12F
MDSKQKPPHQETIPELVARLVIAFEKKQAAKKTAAIRRNICLSLMPILDI